MRYVDTSALLPLYHAEALSPRVAEIIGTDGEPLAFSWLHEIEFQNALQLKQYRGEATEVAVNATLELIRKDATAGVLVRIEPHWPEVFRQTLALSLRYSSGLGTRSLDLLHVGTALSFGIREFVTCGPARGSGRTDDFSGIESQFSIARYEFPSPQNGGIRADCANLWTPKRKLFSSIC